ncbi:MAG: asparaginase [Alicyclobacillaceae bacterium]|nr:asparaginase [Alicyclobacillaceae bacterium]
MPKHILVLHTGGTIAMTVENGVVRPSAEHPLSGLTGSHSLQAEVHVRTLFNKPSIHLTVRDWETLRQVLVEEKDRYDGFVITHGTDTLEETAYFLDVTLPADFRRPVVLTGAMRAHGETGADGLRNLSDSIATACATAPGLEKTVVVVMNGQIHAAARVQKTNSYHLDAFRSPESGPLGYVEEGAVRLVAQPAPSQRLPYAGLCPDVELVKIAFHGGSRTVRHLVDAGVAGIVLEGAGLGHIPPDLLPAVDEAVAAGIPVVIATRCPAGPALPHYDYPGGGVDLLRRGVRFAGSLSGLKARIRLMVGLKAGLPLQQLFP